MATNSSTPQRLYLIQVATLNPPGGIPLPVPCYLVQTDDGTNVLIDSGLPTDAAPPPQLGTVTHGKNVIEQLAELGLRPEDIDILICTHFDMDHAGYHEMFSGAELVVQRTHHEQAFGGHPRFAHNREHWGHPDLRYRLVEGDTELLPGLTLISTSGHAPGHQSVLVRLPQTGPVLLAIDAVARKAFFTPDRQLGRVDDNLEQLSASSRKLLDLAEHEQVTLVVFGHDGEQWLTLKKLPEYYG